MRILQLRFQNLNSLAGEWSIDFTDPAYLADGIFAITGPTGAGKTTILDAICLALYGRTPRLNRVNKSSNEIMSRQTGQCYAELSFAAGEGQFRCHWSQQRARKKPDGELQLPKHEISDLADGQVLETKIREAAALVEKITGMSFEQFTRSMLLAQGGFAAFLQALPDERAPILEQITGTEVYSEISIKVHQRRGEEKARLENLQAEMAGIKLLSVEEEQVLKETLQAKNEQELEEKGKLDALREALAWLDKLAGLSQEIRMLEEQWQDGMAREQAFEPERRRLERARQAMRIDASYVKLLALREQQNRDLTELDQLEKELPHQKEAGKKARQLFQQAAEKLGKLRSTRKEQEEIIKKVRELDLLLEQRTQQITTNRLTAGEEEKACSALRALIKMGQQQRQEMNAELDEIESYIRQNSADTSLLRKFSGIDKSFARVQESSALLDKKQIERDEAITAQQAWIRLLEARTAAYEEKSKQLTQSEKELKVIRDELQSLLQGRELNAWREELEALQEQRNMLGELQQSSSKIQQARVNIKNQQESRAAQQAQQALWNAEIRVREEKVNTAERELKQLETQVTLLSRIRDLEEERARLEDGKACPLCGAIEHPFARGNLPRIDEAESARDQISDMLSKLNDELHDLNLEIVKLEKDIGFTEAVLEEQKLLWKTETKHVQQILQELNLEAWGEASPEDFRHRSSELEKTINEYAQTLNHCAAGQDHERQLTRQYDENKIAMMQAQNEQQQAAIQQEQARQETNRLQGECDNLRVHLDLLQQEAWREVAEYGITPLLIEDMPDILDKLRVRQANWIARQNAKSKLEQAAALIQTDLTKQETLLETREIQRQQTIISLQELEQQVQKLQAARWELYGDRNPSVEEESLDRELREAEAALDKLRKDMDLAQSKQERLQEQAQSLGASTRNRARELQSNEVDFTQHLGESGFEHEDDYLQAILPVPDQQALAQAAEQLRDEKTELQTRLFDRKDTLRLEKEKALTEQPREVLEEQRRLAEQALKLIQDAIGADKHLLQSSHQSRMQMQEQLQKIEAQKDECRRWELLHSLIGSADGKKYRNFAQGLTFDIMIAHANRQLQKMSDRYLLLRNSRQALALNVIDNYQAGEIRSTANLSGGESFLVSLALALGLSRMASRKVSVDSLFLDEGFGALDEDALDTALDTLAGLQRDGKLIGLISHVPALKERIATRIQVISKSGGRSIIQGPGCTQLKR